MPERFCWTKKKIEGLVRATLEGESAAVIARRLGCIDRTARDMQIELELVKPLGRKDWKAAELKLLRKLYPMTDSGELAKRFGVTKPQLYGEAKRLGLRKAPEFLSELGRKKLTIAGVPHRFKSGLIPHNKGTRRPGWAPGRMAETQFKKGERRGAANRNWKPIGTILPDTEGFLRIKVREWRPGEATGFGNTDIWPLLNRHVWAQHRGPIPPSHAVVFRDGDRANCAIENLEMISRAQLMKRNTIHKRYPKEMVNAIMLLGAVKRKVREKSEERNHGSAQSSI